MRCPYQTRLRCWKLLFCGGWVVPLDSVAVPAAETQAIENGIMPVVFMGLAQKLEHESFRLTHR